jgi:hypothetical protein
MKPGFLWLLGQAFHEVKRRPKLVAVQAAGNLALFALFYLWLSMPEATVAQVAASLLLGFVLVLGAITLHGMGLAAFYSEAGMPWRHTLRRLPRLLPWGLAMDLLLCLSLYLWVETDGWPFWLLPVIGILALLPCASSAVRSSEAPEVQGVIQGWRYWTASAMLFGSGGALAWILVGWAPSAGGLVSQALSMAVRFGLAFAVALLAWLAVAAFIPRLAMRDAGGQTAS